MSRLNPIGLGAATAVAYFVAARIGFQFAFVAEQITTVWAPTGIALAALLAGGMRLWPAIWIGAFVANAGTAAPLWTAAPIATGNTLEAVVAVWLLRRIRWFDTRFEQVADVLALMAIAATACTTISATVGVATLCGAGVQPWERFGTLWFNWWLGDALGALIVAPAILTPIRHSWSRSDVARAAILVSGTIAVTLLTFGRLFGVDAQPLAFVVFPMAIAAALVSGPAVTPLVVLGASAVAVWHTVRGMGPFAGPDVHRSLVLLHVFMGVLAATAMLLAAAIAERRRAAQQARETAETLRQREEMMRLAQRAGGVATFEWDFRNQVAQCSAEFFRIFGLPARDGIMTGADWERFVHPDDRDRITAHLARVIEGVEAAEADYRITAADGRIRWVSYAGQLQHTPEGDRLLGTVVDITQRKHFEDELRHHAAEVERVLESIGEAEAALRESQDVLALAMRGGSMGAWSRDLVTDEVWWSRELEEIFGVPPGMFGRTEAAFLDFVHPEDVAALREAVARAVEHRTDYWVEFRFKRADGEWRWMEGRGRAVYAADGRPRTLYGLGIDVTNRKRAELELRDARSAAEQGQRQLEEANRELRRRVVENARLYEEAEEANRLKDEFLATLSHELRTPLNAVLGWAHILRASTMQESVRSRALDSLERNARAQAQLVEDLLDVSRIMAGKLQINADAVDLGAVIVHAVDTVRAGVTAKGLRLNVHVPADRRLMVSGDADRLQQIVWNLVSNAMKFTPAGGSVDVELREADSHAELVVRDTGQGIASSFQPYLFQRFRQMDASKTRRHGGLGLGLSIVRHLTEAHGGTVTAESDGEGTGATFRVRLPLRAVETAAAAVPPHLDPALDGLLAGVRALVVDDDADAREVMRCLLESRSARVVTAASAGEALHVLAQDRFDVLIADIGMPEQDGLALIRVVRALPPGSPVRSIAAIAVTAYASVRERDEALQAGFDWHVGKPFDPEQLVAAVCTATAPGDPRAQEESGHDSVSS